MHEDGKTSISPSLRDGGIADEAHDHHLASGGSTGGLLGV
jgi:hypothetical protein